MKIFNHFSGFRPQKFPLCAEAFPIIDLKRPSALSFAFNRADAGSCSSLPRVGDEIESGQPIWEADAAPIHPCPVKGKIVDIVDVPDIRSRGLSPALIVEPDSDTSPKVFPPLDPDKETKSDLKKRLKEAGTLTDDATPRPLIELICPRSESSPKAVVVLAVDREPGVSVFAQLFRERTKDAVSAAALLGKIAGAGQVFIALSQTAELNNDILKICQDKKVKVLLVPPLYPQSLDSMATKRAGAGQGAKVAGLEAALAAFDAVTKGKLQDKKTLTVIGPENKVVGNYRVSVGTEFKDIFAELGLEPKEGDKVAVGGPMLGVAQYSLRGAVDGGVNALTLIPEASIVKWKSDPCVSCGKCVEACPMCLQAHLIGLYSEFGLFEKTEEFEIEQCLECGICASVCLAGRPLSQLIDLAKTENRKRREENSQKIKGDGAEIPADPPPKRGNIGLSGQNPAMSVFSGTPKFTVGFAPHLRTKASLTKMNLAFILALIPTILVGAASQFFGPEAVDLNASFGPVNNILKTLTLEMGLDAGFLWFSGVLGTVVFGAGLGVLTEYLCQALMRQPYHAVNGHGALMGLLIALLMPPSVPLWVMAVGIAAAIFVGKQIFGGVGSYPMHPALVGWLVVLLSWPRYVYPIGSVSVASVNAATIAATAAGGIILWLLGYIRFEIPVGVLAGSALFAFIFQGHLDGGIAGQLFTGHIFLAAFFLAADSTCSPVNKAGLWIYGLGVGFLIMLIRAHGVWPDAIPFAVLLMNILCPLIDRIRPRVKARTV